MTSFDSRFALRDRVIIDGDERLVARVTAVMWREENPQVEIGWFSDGHSRSAWVEEWRISTAED